MKLLVLLVAGWLAAIAVMRAADLNSLVTEAHPLLAQAAGARIELVLQLACGRWAATWTSSRRRARARGSACASRVRRR